MHPLERAIKAAILEGSNDDEEEKDTGPAVNMTTDEKIAMYKEIAGAYNTRHEFKVGDVIKMKPELKGVAYFRSPKASQPAVVVDVFDEPIRNQAAEDGETTYLAPLDIRICTMLPTGRTLIFPADSRYFMPYQQDENKFENTFKERKLK